MRGARKLPYEVKLTVTGPGDGVSRSKSYESSRVCQDVETAEALYFLARRGLMTVTGDDDTEVSADAVAPSPWLLVKKSRSPSRPPTRKRS